MSVKMKAKMAEMKMRQSAVKIFCSLYYGSLKIFRAASHFEEFDWRIWPWL
jgi:hypothetical protein